MNEIDTLTGADNIAKTFGLTVRQVYGLRESGKAPIKKVPGIGLVANKTALERYLYGHDTQTDV
jgi:hypothetical protein